jgi:hypothetical protein
MMNVYNNPQKKEEPSGQISTGDNQILSSAGIEIVPQTKNPPVANVGGEKTKQDLDSIVSQKLSFPVQTPSIKTEHTLDTIAKDSGASPVPPPVATPPKSGYSVDPYRMKPE